MIDIPDQYRKQYLEGERASFDEEPNSCRYSVGSEEAYWWNRGYETAEDMSDEMPQ